MAATYQERRTKPRFSLRVPVEVLLPNSDRITGLTKDVSTSGVYFYAGKPFDAHESLEIVLAFPPEMTWAETRRVSCVAKVVRIDRDTPSGTGIAAIIESHKLLDRSDSSYPFAMVRTPSTR